MAGLRSRFAGLASRVDPAILGLILILAVSNLVVAHPTLGFFPSHDTQFVYQIFFTTYNELLQHGELPCWRPYDSYGMPAGLYGFFSLSFAQSSAMLLGWLIGEPDVLFLFKLSMVLEQSVLALGAFLLARRMSGRPGAGFLAAAGLVSVCIWNHQIWWNFRILYALPLVIWLAVRAVQDRSPGSGGAAALVYAMHLFGNLQYFIGVQLLLVAVVLLPLIRENWGRLPLRALGGFLPGALAALFLALLLYASLRESIEGLVAITPGRLPGSLETRMDSALDSGAGRDWASMAEIVFGVQVHSDYGFHLGLIPLSFLVWLFLYGSLRGPLEQGLLWGAGILLLISAPLASAIAPLTHVVFPFFSKVRYWGYLKGMARVSGMLLMAVAAAQWAAVGGGLTAERGRQALRAGMGVLAVAVVLQFLCLVLGTGLPYATSGQPPDFHLLSLSLLTLWCLILFRASRSGEFGRVAALTWLLLLLEVVSYGYFCQVHSASRVSREVSQSASYNNALAQVSEARPYSYQARRSNVFKGSASIHPLLNSPYPITPASLYVDELVIPGRLDWLGDGVLRLFRAMMESQEEHLLFTPAGRSQLAGRADARLALGGDRDKLFLADRVEFVSDPGAAAAWVRAGGLRTGAVVLEGKPAPVEPGFGQGQAKVVRFSANRLEAEVDTVRGTWLVYTDQWHPGWNALLDGGPVPILRANVAFKGIWVPAGRHRVEFRFGDGSLVKFTQGLSLGMGGLAGLSLVTVWILALLKRGPLAPPAAEQTAP